MSEDWYYLESGSCPPAENMALDEALLEAAPRLQRPVLRFYGWTEPAATFGYFQRYGDVAGWTSLRPLIRRPTGGGLVPHDIDWTYSVVLPSDHAWYALRAAESYHRLHEWIQAAFRVLGVMASLAPDCRKERAGQCFVGAERSDLLLSGRKIAGAAQRRSRNGLLIQGSVQPPSPTLVRAQWQTALRQHTPFCDEISWRTLALDPALRQRACELAQAKYLQAAYSEKR